MVEEESTGLSSTACITIWFTSFICMLYACLQQRTRVSGRANLERGTRYLLQLTCRELRDKEVEGSVRRDMQRVLYIGELVCRQLLSRKIKY